MTGTKPAWKNRMDSTIVEVPAEELLANPFNWRIHTQLQQHAVEGSLNEIGWVDAVKVNTTTQHVVDAHLRATLAYRRGGKTPVPVIYVTLTADEERIALAAIGITAEMGVHDDSKLLEIVQ